MFYIDRVIDFSFLIDMFLQFFLVFYDDERMSWVYDHKAIAVECVRQPPPGPCTLHPAPPAVLRAPARTHAR